MHAIQDHEVEQLRELTSLLELEMSFAQQYLNVLQEAKAEWHDVYVLFHIIWAISSRLRNKRSIPRPAVPPQTERPTHIFQRPSQDNSIRSRPLNRMNSKDASGSSDDGHTSHRSASRSSRRHSESRPSSRPTSLASRSRTESVNTIGDKEKEKEKPRRKSVTGWASSAVDSVTGRGKNKDKFATLPDTENQGDGAEDTKEADLALKKTGSFSSISMKRKDKSKENLTLASPKPPARILKPPSLQEKKVARALYSFSGATDELSFRPGDEITVVSEVLDGWWMGELGGKTGLFPTTHVEVLPPGSRRAPNFRGSDLDSSGGSSHWTAAESDSIASDMDDDRGMRPKSLIPDHSPGFTGPHPDTMSITSSIAEDDDNKRLMPVRHDSDDYAIDNDYFRPPSPPGFMDRKILHSFNSSSRPIRLPDAESTPGKKAPPPPPPRRPTITTTATPPIPERPYRPYRHAPSQSVNSLKVPASFTSSQDEHDRSPFESATELSTSLTSTGCGEFKQSPFQAKGMCSNCFQFHGP